MTLFTSARLLVKRTRVSWNNAGVLQGYLRLCVLVNLVFGAPVLSSSSSTVGNRAWYSATGMNCASKVKHKPPPVAPIEATTSACRLTCEATLNCSGFVRVLEGTDARYGGKCLFHAGELRSAPAPRHGGYLTCHILLARNGLMGSSAAAENLYSPPEAPIRCEFVDPPPLLSWRSEFNGIRAGRDSVPPLAPPVPNLRVLEECTRGLHILVGGNSIARSWAFALAEILEGHTDHPKINDPELQQRQRAREKEQCGKGGEGGASGGEVCQLIIPGIEARVTFIWFQEVWTQAVIDYIESHRPAIAILNAGSHYIFNPRTYRDYWQRTVKESTKFALWAAAFLSSSIAAPLTRPTVLYWRTITPMCRSGFKFHTETVNSQFNHSNSAMVWNLCAQGRGFPWPYHVTGWNPMDQRTKMSFTGSPRWDTSDQPPESIRVAATTNAATTRPVIKIADAGDWIYADWRALRLRDGSDPKYPHDWTSRGGIQETPYDERCQLFEDGLHHKVIAYYHAIAVLRDMCSAKGLII